MPDIRHQILIGAPAEKIYHGITSQEGLAGWWAPAATAEAELSSIARFPFGPTYHKEMKITALVPSKLVKWSCVAGADEWRGTNLSFELQSGDKDTLLRLHPETSDQIQQQGDFQTATLLIFHHDDWRGYTPMFAECNYTWALFLRSLKLLCETGKGRPWPMQHGL